jgi:hypothetical protein
MQIASSYEFEDRKEAGGKHYFLIDSQDKCHHSLLLSHVPEMRHKQLIDDDDGDGGEKKQPANRSVNRSMHVVPFVLTRRIVSTCAKGEKVRKKDLSITNKIDLLDV